MTGPPDDETSPAPRTIVARFPDLAVGSVLVVVLGGLVAGGDDGPRSPAGTQGLSSSAQIAIGARRRGTSAQPLELRRQPRRCRGPDPRRPSSSGDSLCGDRNDWFESLVGTVARRCSPRLARLREHRGTAVRRASSPAALPPLRRGPLAPISPASGWSASIHTATISVEERGMRNVRPQSIRSSG